MRRMAPDGARRGGRNIIWSCMIGIRRSVRLLRGGVVLVTGFCCKTLGEGGRLWSKGCGHDKSEWILLDSFEAAAEGRILIGGRRVGGREKKRGSGDGCRWD
jgi:hypothetical protein